MRLTELLAVICKALDVTIQDVLELVETEEEEEG